MRLVIVLHDREGELQLIALLMTRFLLKLALLSFNTMFYLMIIRY